ncbi:MAG: ATP-binding protein [Gammaproteobacteria bacterium]|nr:ATP-binding protein [Gammaproteobacteria bacterium]
MIPPKLLVVVCCLLCILFFTVDIITPLGVAAGVPYIIVIMISLYIPNNKVTIFFALVTSMLTVIGLFASPIGGEEWKVFTNRLLALLAIWITTFTTLLIKKSHYDLANMNLNLENMVAMRSAELEKTQARLMQANRMAILGQLTATVSHELRNPLSIVNASLYLLKNKLDNTSEPVCKYLHKIEHNIKRCDYIIDELLDYSRNQNAKLSLQNLDELIKSIIEEYEMPEQIIFKCQFNLGDKLAYVDGLKIQRVIINALDNSAQAIINNKNQLSMPVISLLTYTSDNTLYIEIQDNGPGIADEYLEKVFEPLFSTKNYGIGLGMPIIKKIMEQHHGSVEIINTMDTGTRLLLGLPDKDTANTAWQT